MTAPTQGKERGQPRRPRSLPSRLLTLPSLPSWRRLLRAPASRAPWRARPSPPFPRGSPAAPDPLRSWHLTLPRSRSSARSAPRSPGRRGLAAVGRGNPKPRGGGGGKEEDGAFPGATAPFLGRASVWRPLSARLPECVLPRARVPPRAEGHRRGWSAVPSGVPGAGRGRDPDRRVREREDAPRMRGPRSRRSGPRRGREGKDLRGGEARGNPERPAASSAPEP